MARLLRATHFPIFPLSRGFPDNGRMFLALSALAASVPLAHPLVEGERRNVFSMASGSLGAYRILAGSLAS
ncbi:uncharacterized protein VTP21DRAFT_11186 [Calcarisporiella thermophila]|uniref:uncharacterized protein n=1 Tax=Calcarisporiella thermophila TaxID=911321 RepID=UPI003742D39C